LLNQERILESAVDRNHAGVWRALLESPHPKAAGWFPPLAQRAVALKKAVSLRALLRHMQARSSSFGGTLIPSLFSHLPRPRPPEILNELLASELLPHIDAHQVAVIRAQLAESGETDKAPCLRCSSALDSFDYAVRMELWTAVNTLAPDVPIERWSWAVGRARPGVLEDLNRRYVAALLHQQMEAEVVPASPVQPRHRL
jgi:hypothetical protein